ncbi:hypothetical protein [Paenibacillus amylolyticus]|uniref:hypothetical protein n=1 Tax=Paenibacillus amylolyticus TaxID=1451 RepID=UPI003450D0D1
MNQRKEGYSYGLTGRDRIKADTASAVTTVIPTLLRDIRSLWEMTPTIDIPDTHRITNIMIRILHQVHILITTAIVVAATTAVGIVAAETVGVAGIKHHSPITKEGLYPLLCKHNSGTALCRSLAPVYRRGLTIKRGCNH